MATLAFENALNWVRSNRNILNISHINSNGINSKIYKIDSDYGTLCLKLYPTFIDDKRNRLQAEIDFLEFIEYHQIQCCPNYISSSDSFNWALYSWISGTKPEHLSQSYLLQIIEFIILLYKKSNNKKYANSIRASEACLTYSEFIDHINMRLVSFFSLFSEYSQVEELYSLFIREPWESIQNIYVSANSSYRKMPLDLYISPSDIGIHNTLCDDSGKLNFIDFEYSGLDSIQKTICDFILQPDCPLDFCQARQVIQKTYSIIGFQSISFNFLRDMMEIQRLKWVLIILNPYIKSLRTSREMNSPPILRIKSYLEITKNLLESQELFDFKYYETH